MVVDLQEKLLPAIDDGARVLANARLLLHLARVLELPVLVTTQYRLGLGDTVAEIARWRIAGCPSAPHPSDPAAPGAPRFAMTLERCRGTAADVAPLSRTVEWTHEAHRFSVVAGVADRTLEAASRA